MQIHKIVLALAIIPIVVITVYLSNDKAPAHANAAPRESVKEKKINLLEVNYVPQTPRKPIPSTAFTLVETGNEATKQVTLKEHVGKPTILHFWAPWCGACVSEMPEFESFAKANGQDINIISISNDQSGGKSSRDYYTKNDIRHMALYLDEQNQQRGYMAKTMGVQAFPTTIFISADGQEMGRIIGPVEWNTKAGELLLTLLKNTQK